MVWYLYLSEPPDSHFDIACLDTPNCSASCSCERALFFRSSYSFSESAMFSSFHPEHTPLAGRILYILVCNYATHGSNCILSWFYIKSSDNCANKFRLRFHPFCKLIFFPVNCGIHLAYKSQSGCDYFPTHIFVTCSHHLNPRF